MVEREAHRGAILNFVSDPRSGGGFEYFEDGVLLVDGGRIAAAGPAQELLPGLPSQLPVIEHAHSLIVPGLIDIHIHYPQTDVIGSPADGLLAWLRDCTFPMERKFADPAHCRAVAEFFLEELLRNGTTTAMVFCTVHRASVEALFEAAAARRMRLIAGKVLMDRNGPEDLRDSPQAGERESRELMGRWHGRERLLYAITPRFAPGSSEDQLERAGRLAREFPRLHVQSHVAESLEEAAWARSLFPQARSYLDIYDRYGLLRDRAVYAHCIHLDAADRRRMAESGAAAAFCPSSNLFLGSGLFDIGKADAAGMRFSVATDVGAGTSFSMLRTLGDAYKVARLSGQSLSSLRAFYLATLGAARALGLERCIGRVSPGAEADFVVLDLHATPLIERRTHAARSIEETLSVLMTLGDDRAVAETYVLGRRLHRKL